MRQIITTLVLIIFLSSPTISISQQEFSQFLPNAQAIGIGGSDVALPYDPSASYWNPANIAFLTTNRVIFNFNDKSYLNYLGLTRFFPPSLALGLNVFRTMLTMIWRALHWGIVFFRFFRWVPMLILVKRCMITFIQAWV